MVYNLKCVNEKSLTYIAQTKSELNVTLYCLYFILIVIVLTLEQCLSTHGTEGKMNTGQPQKSRVLLAITCVILLLMGI